MITETIVFLGIKLLHGSKCATLIEQSKYFVMCFKSFKEHNAVRMNNY